MSGSEGLLRGPQVRKMLNNTRRLSEKQALLVAAFLSPLLADAEYDAIQKSLGDAVDVVEMSCIFAVYGVFLLLLSHDYAQMF